MIWLGNDVVNLINHMKNAVATKVGASYIIGINLSEVPNGKSSNIKN